MNPVPAFLTGAVLSFAGAAALAWAAVAPLARAPAPGPADRPGSAARGERSVATADATGPDVDAIIARNLLRTDRRPPPARYRPGQPAGAPAASPPQPSLVLVGVLLASPPAALLQGVPGASGDRVVSVGDSVAGYMVVRIEPRWTLLTRGSDTLRLELKELR